MNIAAARAGTCRPGLLPVAEPPSRKHRPSADSCTMDCVRRSLPLSRMVRGGGEVSCFPGRPVGGGGASCFPGWPAEVEEPPAFQDGSREWRCLLLSRMARGSGGTFRLSKQAFRDWSEPRRRPAGTLRGTGLHTGRCASEWRFSLGSPALRRRMHGPPGGAGGTRPRTGRSACRRGPPADGRHPVPPAPRPTAFRL